MRTIGSLTLCRLSSRLARRIASASSSSRSSRVAPQDRIFDGYPDVALENGEQPHLRSGYSCSSIFVAGHPAPTTPP